MADRPSVISSACGPTRDKRRARPRSPLVGPQRLRPDEAPYGPPTIRCSVLAGMPSLDVYCPGCRPSWGIDIRTTDPHPLRCEAAQTARTSPDGGGASVLRRAHLKLERDGNRRTAYSLRHTYICMRLMEGADIYQIAKNYRTSVEMIEKFYAAHIKNTLDAAAINVMRPRRPRTANEPKVITDDVPLQPRKLEQRPRRRSRQSQPDVIRRAILTP